MFGCHKRNLRYVAHCVSHEGAAKEGDNEIVWPKQGPVWVFGVGHQRVRVCSVFDVQCSMFGVQCSLFGVRCSVVFSVQ